MMAVRCDTSRRQAMVSTLVLWAVFFAICAGLGYSCLNRYDPRVTAGLNDTADYLGLVIADPPEKPVVHRSYRVLLPFMARPIYRVVAGHLGTWDAACFALAVVLSAVTATTGVVIVLLSRRVLPEAPLVPSLLFFLNFWIVNYYMQGMVDAGECLAFALVLWVLQAGSWWWLVPVFLFGGAAKETFVVLGFVGAVSWWMSQPRALRGGMNKWAPLILAPALSLVWVVFVGWWFGGSLRFPLAMAEGFDSHAGLPTSVTRNVLAGDFWYGLVWVVPLAIPSLTRLPRTWLAASAGAASAALALGIYHDAGGGNVARPIFSVLAVVLSVAAGRTLMSLCRRP